MNELTLVILLAGGLSGVFVWLLFPGNKSSRNAAVASALNGTEPLPSAKHYRYFPQIRQALSAEDADYLSQNAPPKVAQQALRERRKVARNFVDGLHEDFSNLERLGRIVAALSPEVSRHQEAERLLIALKFRMVYSLVRLRLAAGTLPIAQLQHLTGLVGRLAARMDESMAEISALSAGQARYQEP
jgi:hypothetical protein